MSETNYPIPGCNAYVHLPTVRMLDSLQPWAKVFDVTVDGELTLPELRALLALAETRYAELVAEVDGLLLDRAPEPDAEAKEQAP